MALELLAIASKFPEIATTTVGAILLKKILEVYMEKGIEDGSRLLSQKFHINALKAKYSKTANPQPQKIAVEKIKKLSKFNVDDTSVESAYAFARYCVLLSEAYRYLPDDKLLQILKERGCIDDEDILQLK